MKNIIIFIPFLFASCSGETPEKPQSTHPVWSPDGNKIAFINNSEGVANDNAIDFEVFTADANGSNITQHTFNDAFEADLAWSEDGRMLAFKSYRDQNDEVYVLNLATGEQKNISNHPAFDGGPQFVGGKLIFSSKRDHESGELYAYDFNLDSISQITFNDFSEVGAVWSPDDKFVVFTSNQDGDDDLYLMKSNGDSMVQLTNNPLNDWYPQWSPDSDAILFTYGDWETDIWELRQLDLKNLKQTTLIEGNDSGNASWHPDRPVIAYGSSKPGPGHLFVYDLTTNKEVQLTK